MTHSCNHHRATNGTMVHSERDADQMPDWIGTLSLSQQIIQIPEVHQPDLVHNRVVLVDMRRTLIKPGDNIDHRHPDLLKSERQPF